MKTVSIQSVAQTEICSLFTICAEGEAMSELEKFIVNNSQAYSNELNIILSAINRMLNMSGFLERYFRPEGKMNDHVCALPIQSGKLRLYCLRLNDSILIVGNGGVKTARRYEDCPELNGYVLDLQQLDKALKIAIKRGDITIEEKTLNNIDDFKFAIE